MSSNFVRFQEILNQALAENFTCLTQKLANPPLKSGSSFPNRDPLYVKKNQKLMYVYQFLEEINPSLKFGYYALTGMIKH